MTNKTVYSWLLFSEWLVAAALTLMLAVPGFAISLRQEPAHTKVDTSKVVPVESEEYRIGPGDLLDIYVDKAPELSGPTRVSGDGTFTMHYLGTISAEQRTAEQVARSIADRLRGKYLTDPRVRVDVKEYNSPLYFIQGSVRQPGPFRVRGKTSLMKLILIAGGLAENHGSTAFVIREARHSGAVRAEEGPTYEMKKVDVGRLFNGGFDEDLLLEPGDIVNIAPTDYFYVVGAVMGPGSFPIKTGATLRQAISLARGTTAEANKGATIIHREEQGTKKPIEVKVDIGAVMSGKAADLPLLPNDVVFVPSSKMRSVGSALLRGLGLMNSIPFGRQ